MTSVVRDEFLQLVPPFEAAFQAQRAAWRLDGKPRTARQWGVTIMGTDMCCSAYLFHCYTNPGTVRVLKSGGIERNQHLMEAKCGL